MEKSKDVKAKKYIILGRHGERSDFAYIKKKTEKRELRPGDPQLTDVGFDQARQTGEMIKDLLIKWNVSTVKIFSSPLIRGLQTAMSIAEKLDVNKIETHDGFVDIITKRYMPLPLNEIELRTKGSHLESENGEDSDKLEHCVTKRLSFYFQGFENIEVIDTQKYKKEMIEHGSESQSKGWKRGVDYINRIIDNWDEVSSVEQTPSEAVIITTHAEGIDAFCYHYTKEFGEIDYCAVSALGFDKESNYYELVLEREYAWREKAY